MPATPPRPADPRPVLGHDGSIIGTRCTACGHVAARRHGRCERCLGATEPASFGPGGTVWASTTVHLRIGDLEPPFVLAYVDVDDGPRVLARVRDATEVPMGAAVRFVNGPVTPGAAPDRTQSGLGADDGLGADLVVEAVGS